MKVGPAKSCPSCGERYDTDVLFCPRDGTPLASTRNPSFPSGVSSDRDPYVGVELPGQIRVDHLIGIGSMGRVYRAFQGGIERDVAVKVLHRELSGSAELTTRFHREAKVASRLIHPNVVQVLMTGALPQSADARTGGELYLVMEYLDGISLLSALAAAGTSGEGAALPLARALHITLQVCDAVGEAHAQGIVHRDIKPENVMLVRRGDDADYVKVLDFGIARLDWADRGMATQAGLIFGTAKYISPEGAEGHPVGPPADVYSIATMLYQMLAGRTPFEGDSPVALLVQHTHAPPTELRTIARASYVPAPLAAAIMANLSKKPAERAQNAPHPRARAGGGGARERPLSGGDDDAVHHLLPAGPGAVKLASKERTRAHELSADLASKIGGVPTLMGGAESDGSAAPAPMAVPMGAPPPNPGRGGPQGWGGCGGDRGGGVASGGWGRAAGGGYAVVGGGAGGDAARRGGRGRRGGAGQHGAGRAAGGRGAGRFAFGSPGARAAGAAHHHAGHGDHPRRAGVVSSAAPASRPRGAARGDPGVRAGRVAGRHPGRAQARRVRRRVERVRLPRRRPRRGARLPAPPRLGCAAPPQLQGRDRRRHRPLAGERRARRSPPGGGRAARRGRARAQVRERSPGRPRTWSGSRCTSIRSSPPPSTSPPTSPAPAPRTSPRRAPAPPAPPPIAATRGTAAATGSDPRPPVAPPNPRVPGFRRGSHALTALDARRRGAAASARPPPPRRGARPCADGAVAVMSRC